MLAFSEGGRPEIRCSKCHEPVPVDEAVAVKFPDLSSALFACIDCAEEIKGSYPRIECQLAREYFETLLAKGRASRVSRES